MKKWNDDEKIKSMRGEERGKEKGKIEKNKNEKFEKYEELRKESKLIRFRRINKNEKPAKNKK